MAEEKVSIETPLAIGSLTIFPVVQTYSFMRLNQAGLAFYGFKKPLAILVKNIGAQTRVILVTGEEVTLKQIVSQYPELGRIKEW